MENIIIRKAKMADLSAILDIYDDIFAMEEQGLITSGWIKGIYPSKVSATEAINADEMFVMEDGGNVVAALRINQVQMPAYAEVKWEIEATPDKVMSCHTLVVSPKANGMGYGTRFVKFFEDYALENGCPYLRIDTNARNIRARALYARLGYKESGIINCVFCGIPNVGLVCMEKALAL